MAEQLDKKPAKGILKNSSSFENRETPVSTSAKGKKKSKETKWDEMNIIATLHPPDKDYGHMKIEEPKTPYHYEGDDHPDGGIDPTLLAEKIRMGANSSPKGFRESDEEDSEEEEESPEQRVARKSFESKRSAHYNEFNAVKLARKLMEESDDDDGEEKADSEPSEKSPRHAAPSDDYNDQPSSSK